MADQAHEETDQIIDEIEKKLRKEYTQAEKELEKKCQDYFSAFEKRDRKKQADLKDGKITEAEYKEWRIRQMMTGKRWEDMRDTMANDLIHVREIADSIVRDRQYDIYALNHNWGAYEIESGTGIDTDFTMYDHDTVAELMKGNERIIPEPGKKTAEEIRQGTLKKWADREVQSVVMQSILQGESIPHMAKRISETLGEKDRKAAVRTARTACTSAENLGRIHSYQRAERMGIVLKKQWMSAHDSRTRDWHRELDGVSVPINEPFENAVGKIRYPGDFSAAGANVYNCRCCLVAAVNRHEIDGSEVYRENHSPELDGISWEDWKKGKKYLKEKQRKFEQAVSEVKSGSHVSNEVIQGITNGEIDPEDLMLATTSIKSRDYASECIDNIMSWSGDAYSKIRVYQEGKLQNNFESEYFGRMSGNIEKFIDASVKWSGGTTYRAIGLDGNELEDLLKKVDSKEEITMKGTASWTSDEECARTHSLTKENRVIFVCNTQKRGTSIVPYATVPYEHEVISSKDARYKPVKTEKKDGFLYIYLEE